MRLDRENKCAQQSNTHHGEIIAGPQGPANDKFSDDLLQQVTALGSNHDNINFHILPHQHNGPEIQKYEHDGPFRT